MRLGDIDAVTEKLLHDSFCSWHDYNTVMHALDEAPTIDAVPVVRCKDCKHYKDGLCYFTMRRHGLHDDWFCADGEKVSE